jgi:tetratricopeptide (TPR) repeat protein
MRLPLLASTLALSLLGSTACGGGGGAGKGDNTTPDQQGGGSLIGDNSPNGPIVGAPTGGGGAQPTDEPKDQPVATEEPEMPKAEPPKPPGQDLDPVERERIIKSHMTIGNEAARKGDADAMIREGMAVLDVDETNVDAMVLLAHGYYLKGYLDKSEAVTEEALKQEKARSNAKLYMIRGLIFDKTSREDAALEAYTKATDNDAGYAAAWTNRGVIYLKRRVYSDLNPGAKDGAVSCFETALKLIGRNRSAKAHNHMGSAYRGLANDDKPRRDDLLKKAEGEFKTAMTVDPNYPPSYFNLGLLYFDADPFPGMDKLQRLSMALRYLKEYQRIMGPNLKPGDKVEEYLATGQKAYDLEEKAQKRKKEKEEKDRLKKQQEAEKPKEEEKPAEGGGGGNE